MSYRTRRVWILTSLAGLALTVACAPRADVAVISAQSTQNATNNQAPPTTSSIIGPDQVVVQPEIYESVDYDSVIITDGAKPPKPQDELVALSIADLERWWATEYPAVYGEEFVPIQGGFFAAYRNSTSPVPACGPGRSTPYEELQLYAAFYCGYGDFIAFDDDDGPNSFIGPIVNQYGLGPSVFGVVLAHEYGHAIQGRRGTLDLDLPTIYTEQQADCFSGAWVRQSYNGESPMLKLGDADVRSGLFAMLEIRDPVGSSQFDPGGHGSAFDRVGAFEEGFLHGASRCAELIDDPLELIPNEFVSGSDIELYSEGNVPYECSDLDLDQMIEDGFDRERAEQIIASCIPGPVLLEDDLNSFWKAALGNGFPTLTSLPADDLDIYDCSDRVQLDAYVLLCPSRQTVVYNGPAVQDLYRQFGDFTLGYLVSTAWAQQAQIYQNSTLQGEQRALLNDCYTGAWVRDITPRPGGSPPTKRDPDGDGIPNGLASSPGDLDEATRMVILIGDEGVNTNQIGSAFEKIGALREGALGGYEVCAGQLPTG